MKRTNRLVATGWRLARTLALLAGGLLTQAGCEQGAEGDRCNPDLSHNECNAGLSCQQPAECPENYCCPTSGPVSSPFCMPTCNGGLASICAADPTADACADAGPPPDASPDTSAADTGSPDSSSPDTGSPDTGSPDTGTKDTGTADTGPKDSGAPDTGGPRDASQG
jgi:hypothetical protein